MNDFRDKALLDKPRGAIYSGSGNEKLLNASRIVVDVVAQALDEFRNKMSANRFVLAALNLDTGWAVITSKHTDAGQSFTMQRKDQRRPELERAPFQRGLCRCYTSVVLPKDISRFGLGSRLRVRDELRL
jgi:hypothetical protein